MKKLLLLSIILSCLSFLPKKESIIWEGEKQLKWSDFKARAPRASSYEALSAVGISAGLSFNEQELNINVESFFTPKLSWTKDKKSLYLLNHEQKHFDISEIHARKLRKEFSETKWNIKSASKTFNKLLKKYSAEENAMQEKYDKESKHSINKDIQEVWNKKIKEELNRLEKHSESIIKITNF